MSWRFGILLDVNPFVKTWQGNATPLFNAGAFAFAWEKALGTFEKVVIPTHAMDKHATMHSYTEHTKTQCTVTKEQVKLYGKQVPFKQTQIQAQPPGSESLCGKTVSCHHSE